MSRSAKMILAVMLGVSVLIAAPLSSAAQTTKEQVTTSQSGAAQKQTLRSRAKARFEAMKKRWAQNNAKFTACSDRLTEAKKTKRMSIHRQTKFMEACMRE